MWDRSWIMEDYVLHQRARTSRSYFNEDNYECDICSCILLDIHKSYAGGHHTKNSRRARASWNSTHGIEPSSLQYYLSPNDLICRQTSYHGWPGKLLSTLWALQVFVRVVLGNAFMPALDQLAFAILVILQIHKCLNKVQAVDSGKN